jgi:4-aminobutyrate aminotransferase/(S)-3-amino-2-methylpropionate transaminase
MKRSLFRLQTQARFSIGKDATRSSGTRQLGKNPSMRYATAAAAQASASADISSTGTRPDVRTEIPGPQAVAFAKNLDEVFDIRSLNMVVDYNKSDGNLYASFTE